ncbi:HAD family hydrolase [Citreimonas sp.]|uniref:HAD family hydrolase n=1 Tax=Citreimonas sp. TaxID=3036715 RepID=UPI0035C82176
MARNLTTIGFDADDTLWHNEKFFKLTQDRFAALLADHVEGHDLETRLLAAERRNIGHYGFGVKGFVLSMIETAIEVTDGRVPASVISDLLAAGREMLDHPIELLPHAREAVEAVAGDHRVVLITKGDLLHQERKLAQSGLGELFDAVEIVSDKRPETYARIFGALPGGVAAAMMVGNSMKSDVVPAVAAGGHGVFVPHDLGWALEKADAPVSEKFHEIDTLADLPALVERLA